MAPADYTQETGHQFIPPMDSPLNPLLGMFNDFYASNLEHELLGYTNIKTLQLINHLNTAWRLVTTTQLEAVKEKMKKPLDSARPISTIWEQITKEQTTVPTTG
eukprot:15365225-Ditylum_brightwellii.AAC.1